MCLSPHLVTLLSIFIQLTVVYVPTPVSIYRYFRPRITRKMQNSSSMNIHRSVLPEDTRDVHLDTTALALQEHGRTFLAEQIPPVPALGKMCTI